MGNAKVTKSYEIMNAKSQISDLAISLTEIAHTKTKLKFVDTT